MGKLAIVTVAALLALMILTLFLGLYCGGRRMVDPPAGPFTSVSVGYNHVCGLRPGGSVECWSYEQDSPSDYFALDVRLFTPRYQDFHFPAPVGRFSVIDSKGHETCGIRLESSQIECWRSMVHRFIRTKRRSSPTFRSRGNSRR